MSDRILLGMIEEVHSWNDAQILESLRSLPIPPDYTQPWSWADDLYDMRFAALAIVADERKLQSAIPLLLERATITIDEFVLLSDVLYRLGKSDYSFLKAQCIIASQSARSGSRFWAIHTLRSILNEEERFELALQHANDPEIEIREEVARILAVLYIKHPDYRSKVTPDLEKIVRQSMRWRSVRQIINETQAWIDNVTQ